MPARRSMVDPLHRAGACRCKLSAGLPALISSSLFPWISRHRWIYPCCCSRRQHHDRCDPGCRHPTRLYCSGSHRHCRPLCRCPDCRGRQYRDCWCLPLDWERHPECRGYPEYRAYRGCQGFQVCRLIRRFERDRPGPAKLRTNTVGADHRRVSEAAHRPTPGKPLRAQARSPSPSHLLLCLSAAILRRGPERPGKSIAA